MLSIISETFTPPVLANIAVSGVVFFLVYRIFGLQVLGEIFANLSERHARIHGYALRANALNREADDLHASVSARLASARVDAAKARDELLAIVKEEQEDLFMKAAQEVEYIMKAARSDILASKEAALSDAQLVSSRLSTLVVERLLSRSS